jgi:hypothetical protein
MHDVAFAGMIEARALWIRARESRISLWRWRRGYPRGPPWSGIGPKDIDSAPVVPRYCSPGLPIIAAGDFCCPQSSTSHRDDVKLLRIKSFDCIRKMDGEKRCFDASPAIRKAIEPCRHVLAPLTGVFSCWEQTDAAPLPPLRLFQASELLEASTHGEAQTAFAMPLLSTYDTVDREVAESPWCTAPG